MAGITIDIAQAKLATWLAAEEAVALGQSVTSDTGRTLTRANLADIRTQIDYWSTHVAKLTQQALGTQRQRPVIVVDA
jgi:hypothetical protein